MRSIKQKHIINATAEEVYIALTNPLTIELWSGYKAEMRAIPESEFSIFDGDIVGRNLAFEENVKIEQEWYFGDQNARSMVKIELQNDKSKTKVELIHTNVPDEAFEDIKNGWKDYYWGALKKYFK